MENKDKSLELLESIKSDLSKLDGISKDAKEAKAEALKAQTELDAKVKELNITIAAKDGTLKDIQDEVNNLKAKQGKVGAFKANAGDYRTKEYIIKAAIADQFEKNFAGLTNTKAPFNLDLKASPILSSNLTGNYVDYLPAAAGQRPFGQTHFRDMSSTYQSSVNTVQFPQQNAAPNSGTFNFQQSEGSAKSQLDYTWTMQTVNLYPFAGYAIVSRQSLQNIPFLQTYLPMNLMEDMLTQEDLNFGAQLYAAATGSTSTSGAGSVDAEQLIFLMKNLMVAKYSPNGIAVDPAKWASMLITKPSNYSLPNAVTIDSTGTTRVLGQPVYPVNWLSGGKVIVGQWDKVGIVESDGLVLRQSDSHASTFIANELTYLLERTEGLAIFRPDAFVATTLA